MHKIFYDSGIKVCTYVARNYCRLAIVSPMIFPLMKKKTWLLFLSVARSRVRAGVKLKEEDQKRSYNEVRDVEGPPRSGALNTF